MYLSVPVPRDWFSQRRDAELSWQNLADASSVLRHIRSTATAEGRKKSWAVASVKILEDNGSLVNVATPAELYKSLSTKDWIASGAIFQVVLHRKSRERPASREQLSSNEPTNNRALLPIRAASSKRRPSSRGTPGATSTVHDMRAPNIEEYLSLQRNRQASRGHQSSFSRRLQENNPKKRQSRRSLAGPIEPWGGEAGSSSSGVSVITL